MTKNHCWQGHICSGMLMSGVGRAINGKEPAYQPLVRSSSEKDNIYVDKIRHRYIPRLYEEMDRSRLSADQIVIISFHSDVICEFKLARPEHKAFLSSGLRKDENGNIVPEIETVLETPEKTGSDGVTSGDIPVHGNFQKMKRSL